MGAEVDIGGMVDTVCDCKICLGWTKGRMEDC